MPGPPPNGGSIAERLGRIESKIDRMQDKSDQQAADLIEVKAEGAKQAIEVRALQDWRIEMTVYLKQIRWTLVVAGAALLVGLVNIVLNVGFQK